MFDLIADAIGTLLEFVVTDWRPIPRQRVKLAVRLSRKRSLSAKQREFSRTWLTFGLGHLADLRLESREQEIRTALDRVQQSPDAQR